MEYPNLPSRQWSFLHKMAILSLTIYLFFLFFDFTSDDEVLPHFVYVLFKPYAAIWDWLVPWTGKNILHIGYPITVKPNGSGDTTYNYVMQLLWIVLALLMGLILAILDKKRTDYTRLYYWVRIFTRYYFAYILFSYGFIKIIKLQFPAPGLLKLVQPFGTFSPQALAWNFIGYSTGYNIFIGGSEVIAGILLFFKRTTLLGSLIAMSIMVNVFAFNMAYDIPVKIFSFNLIFLSALLAAPDIDRLKGFFLLNLPVPAANLAQPAKNRRKLTALRALKIAVILFVLYETFWEALNNYIDKQASPPFYGIYNVEQFIRQGPEIPLPIPDSIRWKQMIINYPGEVRITTMADSQKYWRLKLDTVNRNARFSSYQDSSNFFSLVFTEPDKDHLIFSGNFQRDSMRITMKRFDLNQFRLLNRGFHWINEYPYYR